MALINCPDCSSSVSDQAESCNKCGRPIRKEIQRMRRQLQIQGFWKKSLLPGMRVIFVFVLTYLLGVMTKFVSLFFTIPGLMDSTHTLEDLFRYALSESGMFVVYSFAILGILVKYRCNSWLNEVFPEHNQEKVEEEKEIGKAMCFDCSVTMDRCSK